jgi:DNA (cytosine-5)-methyltransferase 1
MKANMKYRPAAVDLFAGAGGMSLGFEQAGFDVVAAVEHDPIHCATHAFNFPETEIVCKKIEDVEGKDLLQIAENSNRRIEVIFGGPPCQGFSMIGKRSLDDSRNRLVWHFVRIVAETKAKYFVFENVKGLTLGKHKAFLDELVEEFDRNGYSVRIPWRILNAAEFGVPQNRHRLFLLGCRKDLRLPEYPMPTTSSNPRKPAFHLPPAPTVWEALMDLPNADEFDELLESDHVRAIFGEPSDYSARLRGLVAETDDLSYPRKREPDILTSSLRAVHSSESRKRFSSTPAGTTEPVSRFFKLDPKGISNTLRAGTGSDRGAFTSPRPIHPIYPRCITVREAARLHSFPDWFRFHSTKWHGARQVGNSVPPLLARAVAKKVIEALCAKPPKPRRTIRPGDEKLLKMNMKAACSHFGVSDSVIPKRIKSM